MIIVSIKKIILIYSFCIWNVNFRNSKKLFKIRIEKML
ncbi:hypothetical protein IMSAGC008_01503 [Muribaculaceae bacterium]|nr:hypothetical protein IMSAGC008_01503 [Muribaculaceae bacterium]